MSNPLYTNPVIGYRTWNLDPGLKLLKAKVIRTPWDPEEPVEAVCVQKGNNFWAGTHIKEYDLPLDHESPAEGCSCGLYAWHSISDAATEFSEGKYTVVGAAIFWGTILVHTAGFKAQYGRVVALTDHHPTERDVKWRSDLESIVARYNVPVVPYDLLQEYAETFGSPLGSDYLN